MKFRLKLLVAFVSVLLIFTAACSNKGDTNTGIKQGDLDNLTDSGLPIVKETIELDFFTGKSLTNVNVDWNDLLLWNEYEDQTNMKINWIQVDGESLEERRNLALAGSDDLPDVFYAATVPNSDLLKYGEQGTFLPLNDLIEEHAPNFKKLLEEYPDVQKAITFPDGNIYALPVIYDPEFTSLMMNSTPWFNVKWLENLGMEIPRTTEDFYDYLKAVKEGNPSGDPSIDEIPFGAYTMNYLIDWLKGSFGVGTTGVNYIDLHPKSDEFRFYPISDEYKQMLEYVNRLYDEGLIEQNIFSIEFAEYLTNAADGRYGSTVWYSPREEFGEVGAEFEGGYALEGPEGYSDYVDIGHPAFMMGRFVITNANEHPEATMRWVDHFYGDEGAKFFYMGIEGVTYEEAEDGSLKYVDRITNSPDGLTMNEELVKDLAWVGSSAPSIIKQDYFQGTENSPQALEASTRLEPDFIENRWPSSFTFTAEENRRLNRLASDIEKYVNEERDRFINGDKPFSEWDDYVDTLNKMGLDEYMEIQKAAYERYLEH